MRQLLNRSAKTTHTIRALIQRSNAARSRKPGINVKTVAKWRKQRIAAAAIVAFTALGHFQGCSWSIAPQYALAQTVNPATRKVKVDFNTWADTSNIKAHHAIGLAHPSITVSVIDSEH